ncbi:RNA-binding S4 domain-containing protein [Zhengella sp. ZM62]|uniref:RNA-binding S4 domain-containing protein n=1 Tax=Zhengella sedimenti TaxID=3390035 RepID=UPI00397547F9
MTAEAGADGGGRQRLDKWLFFARIVKSRSLAAKLVQSGRVRVNRDKTESAAKAVRPGDVLTVTLEGRVLVLKIVAPGARRGPYEEARLLYEDLSPPPPSRDERLPDQLLPVREAGKGRPTKKERRQTDRLKGSDG